MFKVISVSGLYRADTCAERDALNVRHSRALLSRVANAAPKVAHRALPYWIGDVCSERSLVREPIASCAYLHRPVVGGGTSVATDAALALTRNLSLIHI